MVEDGMVFYYDTGNGKSYKGEPTTNLYGNWNAYTGGSYEVLDNNTNYIKLLASAGAPWAGQFTAAVSAGTYTVSFQHRTDDGGSNNFNIDNDTQDDNLWNANITTTTEWQTYTSTKTHTGTGNHLLYFRRNGGTGNIYIRNLQLELKSHATPFTKGTRSATEGLKDLTGNSTLDLTNVSFDSNAQITFDGSSDRIDMNAQNLVGAAAGTVTAWLKLSEANVNHAGIFCCQVGPAWADMRVVLNVSSPNRIRLAISDGTTSTQDGCRTNSALSYDTWYHIVATYDGTSAKIYINGVLDETHNTTVTPGTFTPGATMVGSQNYSNRYFNGNIAAVSTHNKALSAEEVKNHFNGIRSRFGI